MLLLVLLLVLLVLLMLLVWYDIGVYSPILNFIDITLSEKQVSDVHHGGPELWLLVLERRKKKDERNDDLTKTVL